MSASYARKPANGGRSTSAVCGGYLDFQLKKEDGKSSLHFKVRLNAQKVNEMLEQDAWEWDYKSKKVRSIDDTTPDVTKGSERASNEQK